MHSKPTFKKTQVKHSKSSEAPHPNIITQVSKKETEKKFQLFDVMNIFRCCSLFWKCLPTKKSNFNQITETTPALLEPQLPQHKGKKVLVLDLDETLVHSTFEPVENPDLVLPVRIQGMTYRINVIIRPGAEEFLARVKGLFEVVVFTASLAEYAEPLVQILDPTHSVSSLLYRQHCTPMNGIYVKDLSLIGRDMKDIILVDNSPNSFLFQPENAYHIKNFFDDKSDRELMRLAEFLDNIMKVSDVRPIEELRKRYEPKHSYKNFKFVKVSNQDSGELEMPEINVVDPSKQPVKRKEERERSYNIETEPDLRKDAREGEFQQYRIPSERNKKQANYLSKAVPLTERVPSNDRFGVQALDSSVEIELPSPKESDALINHREADAYYSGETDSKDSKKDRNLPPYLQSHALHNINTHKANVVAVDESEIEGHKVEEFRYHTGFDNLNSPLGRHVKIEFNNKMVANS